MKVLNILMSLAFAGVLWCCGSANRNTTSVEDKSALEQMIAKESFRFEADWAQPLVTNSLSRISNAGLLPAGSTAGRINLIGNFNYLEVNGDSVTAYLPYYGERQMAGGYNSSDNGINFKGVAEHMEAVRDEKDSGYQMNFTIRNHTESFQVKIELYSNLRGIVNINSSYRQPIRYDGKVIVLEENSAEQFK